MVMPTVPVQWLAASVLVFIAMSFGFVNVTKDGVRLPANKAFDLGVDVASSKLAGGSAGALSGGDASAAASAPSAGMSATVPGASRRRRPVSTLSGGGMPRPDRHLSTPFTRQATRELHLALPLQVENPVLRRPRPAAAAPDVAGGQRALRALDLAPGGEARSAIMSSRDASRPAFTSAAPRRVGDRARAAAEARAIARSEGGGPLRSNETARAPAPITRDDEARRELHEAMRNGRLSSLAGRGVSGGEGPSDAERAGLELASGSGGDTVEEQAYADRVEREARARPWHGVRSGDSANVDGLDLDPASTVRFAGAFRAPSGIRGASARSAVDGLADTNARAVAPTPDASAIVRPDAAAARLPDDPDSMQGPRAAHPVVHGQAGASVLRSLRGPTVAEREGVADSASSRDVSVEARSVVRNAIAAAVSGNNFEASAPSVRVDRSSSARIGARAHRDRGDGVQARSILL